MGRSLIIAFVAVIALTLWMLSGQLGSDSSAETESTDTAEVQEDKQGAMQQSSAPKMKVQTEQLQAQSIEREIVIQGQLEPAKVMTLRAETSGNVRLLSFSKGQRIRRGQTLARLSEGNRVADLAVAKASEVQANNEYQAARKLSQQGLQSKFSLETATAKREAARAQVHAAELELGNINIGAPIDALIENVMVEEGDFIERGAHIATLVDNSSLLVTGRIPQQHIADIQKGQTALTSLVTGQQLQGTVQFVSSMADDTTRSFEIEVLITDTPESVMTGISAQITIPVETLMAHLVSPAVLALDDDGALGVKALSENNTVEFHPIEIVKTENNGAWVIGLPDTVTLITLGQGFVNPGEEVEPVSGTEASDANNDADNPPSAPVDSGNNES